MTGRSRLLAVILGSYLMIVLDASIVINALPRIHHALGFSATGLSWVQNAYTLTFGGLLLLGARAGDILGRRRMFVVGIAVFALASLAAGAAQSATWLLAARAVQGAASACSWAECSRAGSRGASACSSTSRWAPCSSSPHRACCTRPSAARATSTSSAPPPRRSACSPSSTGD